MPGLQIEFNGSHVSTIDVTSLEVVTVSVFGGVDHSQKAVLAAHGGTYTDGKCGHLIWIDQKSLAPGDVVRVKLLEACEVADQGKTIDELFSDDEPFDDDLTTNPQGAAEHGNGQRHHEDFTVQADIPDGQHVAVEIADRNITFEFLIGWNWTQATQARVHLITHSRDEVLARKGGTRHVQSVLSFGEVASFSLVS